MLNIECVNGYYLVDSKIYTNKLLAILEASKKNTTVTWHYYDDIFLKAAEKFVYDDDIRLIDLYKIKAQLLRDKYDYLILNYSGGSDSHNILMTFLTNNIKLDCLFVQWPISLMNKGLYVPNDIDKSNSNFHSEWDLVLKKDLEYVSSKFPKIHIEIADWTNTINDKFYNDLIFEKDVTNLPSITRSQKQNTFSKIETILANKGKKIGSIFGVDKPCIVHKEGHWFFYFIDTACMAYANTENMHGVEYFYWDPGFPDIVLTQAHKMKTFFDRNKNKAYLVQSILERCKLDPTYSSWSYEKHYREYAEINEIAKLVCYPHWNFNRFQADKPFAVLEGFKMGTRAWDNILTAIPDFDRIQRIWEYHWKSYLTDIDMKFMRNRDTVAFFKSRWFKFA